jgi:OOP family OmpA-OmpF porin
MQFTVLGIALGLSATTVTAHGHMTYPKSRASEHFKDDVKSWPIAGIPARLRREPCVGLSQNKVFTKVEPGPLTLNFLFPDGANHKGLCTAYLLDPLQPEFKLKIGETTNCGRSIKKGAGRKGQDIAGSMTVQIPQNVPCDPSHCLLQWEWTAMHVSETNLERFEHYDDCADLNIVGGTQEEFTSVALPAGSVLNVTDPVAEATEFFSQEWQLNLDRSYLYLQSVKNKSIFETHGFEHMEGRIEPDGQAQLTLDLASFDTGIDLRNVRMGFLFFETFKFPNAIIQAQLDKTKLTDLLTKTSMTYPLDFTIELHGIKKEYTSDVIITRVADSAVSIAATKPIIVPAEDFGILENVAKLENAAGVVISPVASVTFELVFEGSKINPDIERISAQKGLDRIKELAQQFDPDKCETRLSVLSESGAIYFASGSARLDDESQFALKKIVEFSDRCPGLTMEVGGHTDNVGGPLSNLRLSQKRAQSVVDYLVANGMSQNNVVAMGYGDKFPVVSNTTAANRARNRRIVFGVATP